MNRFILSPDFPEERQGFFLFRDPAPVFRLPPKYYLCDCYMSKLRKVALIGIGIVVLATIGFKIAGIYPGIVAVHALPFCMMLIIDLSRKRPDKNEKKSE